jgi:hypothetical protein
MNPKFSAALVLTVSASALIAQDAKFAAESLKYSRDAYSKVHMVAIAKFSFEQGPDAEFKYDRYPNGGPERIQSGEGRGLRSQRREDLAYIGRRKCRQRDYRAKQRGAGRTQENPEGGGSRNLNDWRSHLSPSTLNTFWPRLRIQTRI